MKKIIIIMLCLMLCILLTGCTQVSQSKDSTAYGYAMIVMPDGSIIKGNYSAFTRFSSGYAMVKIDGVKYYANEWRIVLWE